MSLFNEAKARQPKPTKLPCVACGVQFWKLPTDSMRCNVCEFIHVLLKPMLDIYAPDAVIERVNGTGNLVAKLSRDNACYCQIFPVDSFRYNRDTMGSIAGATYEKVRLLADPSFRFNWKKHDSLSGG